VASTIGFSSPFSELFARQIASVRPYHGIGKQAKVRHNCQNPPPRRSNSATGTCSDQYQTRHSSRNRQMRKLTVLAVAAGAVALVAGGVQAAKAADMMVPQAQAPAPGYAPPPFAGTYAPAPPPPVEYGYLPPPPPVGYYPAYAVWPGPGPYYANWGYWHGYAPRFAYGYGHWGYGWHR
jgi:hypothetical protein